MSALQVRAAQILSPGGDGNSDSRIPFGLEQLAIPSVRYQQVYDAVDFSSLTLGGGFITEIRFRSDPELGRTFTAGLPEIQLNLSTTPGSADNLSLTFADNIGMDDAVVYDRGPLIISHLGGDFDIRISLTRPFFYDPNTGNLLLDVRNFRPGQEPNPGLSAGPFDASEVLGDSSSRVLALDVSATQAIVADTRALETLFIVTPIPEPGSMVLMLFAGAALCLARSQMRRRKG